MRANKSSTLKERLRRQSDAFEFGALLEGVSGVAGEPDPDEASSAPTTRYGTPLPSPSLPLKIDPEPGAASAGASTEPGPEHPVTTAVSLSQAIAARTTARYGTRAADREERLRSILDALGRRLLAEAALFRAAMQHVDAAAAGERLARVNQLCELLHSVDPTGDLARQLDATAAPPADHPWPRSAWSAAELAASPFSALLPQTVPAGFLSDLMFAAWGVEIDREPAAETA